MQKCEKSMPVSPSRGHLEQKCQENATGGTLASDTGNRNAGKPCQVDHREETPGRRNAADVPPCRDVTPASFHETQGNAGAVKIDTDDLNLYMLVQLQDF